MYNKIVYDESVKKKFFSKKFANEFRLGGVKRSFSAARTRIGGAIEQDRRRERESCVWTTTERRLIRTNGRAADPAHRARHTHTLAYTHMHTCAHTRTHTHKHKHSYTRTWVHTQARTSPPRPPPDYRLARPPVRRCECARARPPAPSRRIVCALPDATAAARRFLFPFDFRLCRRRRPFAAKLYATSPSRWRRTRRRWPSAPIW